MTKFESVGLQYQMESTTVKEAQRSFRYSCRVCCEKGLRIDCDRCAIAWQHDIVVAALASKPTIVVRAAQ